MTNTHFEILRCVWHNDASHPHGGRLEYHGDQVDGLLVCLDCNAAFLVCARIPVLLAERELSRGERQKLNEFARRFEVPR